ncbi:MAG TPA: response regulator [Candidatus Melainabacteria bacterium]|nr:response regulator [Candidatus Melainabacteria bacterium]
MVDIRKVLMVDDDQSIRRICQVCLTNVGKWQVVLAESGYEGLELARTEKPDVILLDVMMPGMDGPTTLLKLREDEQLQHIPVILMTAKVQPQEVEQYTRLGASGVISKPFDPLTLPNEIKKLVNGS